MTEKLLSVPQFANCLGVTVSCVRRMVLERRIFVTKIGRFVRIPTSEVDRLVSEGARPARHTAEESRCLR
jgi:excisionase family DNA binding protein